MALRPLGYAFLEATLHTRGFPVERRAQVGPVSRVTDRGDGLLVPQWVAPDSDDPMAHLLFALKHEGINMQAAILALKKIPAASVAQAFIRSPSSRYARTACFLWERANGTALEGLPAAVGAYEKLFDEEAFLADRVQRQPRWRIDFNGIGSPAGCLSVRRTPQIQALLNHDILSRAAGFIAGLDKELLDRTVRRSYLSETDSSYAIERETPSTSKAEAFMRLLARAHDPDEITEEYLVALQNLAVSNPLDHAVAFRGQQNRLRNDLRGALGVTYLPPPPDVLPGVMDQVMALCNDRSSVIDPLVRGSLASFGFVFAHPFMDGNGRLSRFLFHKVACADPRLGGGMVLPISVAMKRNEAAYLEALRSFSRPARALWEVSSVSDQDVDQRFSGEPEIYRYWDATDCVAFGLRMASEALRHDLQQEVDYLARYDAVYSAVNDAVDMNNEDLVLLVRSIAQQGSLSNNRIKQLVAKGHTEEILKEAAEAGRRALRELTAYAGEASAEAGLESPDPIEQDRAGERARR